MGYTMNFAKMDGSFLDKMLKMFNISFPDANTMHCVGRYSGGDIIFDDPIVVEGNKMTVKMSQKNPAFKDVDLYAFQDQDNTQFHIYVNYRIHQLLRQHAGYHHGAIRSARHYR